MGLGLLGFKVFTSILSKLELSTIYLHFHHLFDVAFAYLSLLCYTSTFIISFGLLFSLATKAFTKTKGETFFQNCGQFNIIHLE
jgi:hypothetical protein